MKEAVARLIEKPELVGRKPATFTSRALSAAATASAGILATRLLQGIVPRHAGGR